MAIRCAVTGHPVGTDKGQPCECVPCRVMSSLIRKGAEPLLLADRENLWHDLLVRVDSNAATVDVHLDGAEVRVE